MDLAQRARAYLSCVEEARSFDELAAYLNTDVVLVEHPNRLVDEGKTRRLEDIHRAFEAGRKAVRAQRYGVRTVVADASTVALEVDWEGTLAIPLGALKAGEVMRCSSAMFLRFDAEGRVLRQDNYDCFPPF
jgi:SnoaL-like domain